MAARHRVLVDGAVRAGGRRSPVAERRVRRRRPAARDGTRPAGHRGEARRPLHVARSRDRRARRGGARRDRPRGPDFDDVLARHELAWDHLWFRCDVEIEGPVARLAGPAAARLPPAADRVPAQRRPRRRHPGPRPARRGLPRPRLLGRDVRPALPEPAAARGRPGDAAVPVAPAPPGAGRRAGGRAPGRHVPVAERVDRPRGVADPAPQPAVGPLAAGQLAPAAAHRPRRRLQHLAVLRGDRGHRLPRRARRRADPVDRRVLGRPGHLRPGRRPVRHLRRDGTRRVPRRAARAATSRGWTTTPTRT